MEKVLISVDELNALMMSAAQTALEAHEKKEAAATLVCRAVAARRLRVDLSTLWRWQKQGLIKTIKIGKSVYVTEAELRRLERGEREV